MELGRRSRERPAGGGAHFGPALLEGGGAQLQAPQAPRVVSSETLEQPVGGRGPGKRGRA